MPHLALTSFVQDAFSLLSNHTSHRNAVATINANVLQLPHQPYRVVESFLSLPDEALDSLNAPLIKSKSLLVTCFKILAHNICQADF